ncbi:GNAT family N-acetyltransferase [Proteiniborus sp. MB09-C3]|uniref:GNAT family N-acetyltransferase n=1 Tax=Proteiniborus sp. MB09-C3 TaxID=3050072 RepID=UPI0025568FDD|nr:GNAT family N-acetyltransferase [Proteiniborus sp. MB09-C3]WIV12893.1 GNAT family N-acetyltransferase [Proteiniborus sp. MB09-C3]
MIELRTINEDNYEECLNLSASVANADFVDPVAWSLAEAWVFYDDSRPFAIYADDVMVGYVLMYIGEKNHQIINFMIDSRFQKRGYGVAAARLCVEYLCKEYNASKISLPVEPGNIAAQRLWSRVGFEMTDDMEDGYLFMRLYIPKY